MLQHNHFRLTTLGRLALSAPVESGPAEELAKQRRKLAVLAVLALSPRPVSRDTLIEMFWSERDERRARHSLSEALSHLRRLLGPDAITTRETEVSLAAGTLLEVDAVELADAAARGDGRAAIELYGGPFLDAVYVGGSSTFEEWVGRERRRLERLFTGVLERYCRALFEAGRFEECVVAAERWLQADPMSESAMHVLLDATLALGTPGSEGRALRSYEALRQGLARGYELEPPAEIRARIDELRGRRAEAAADVVPARALAPAAPAQGAAVAAAAEVATPEVSATLRPRRRRVALVAAAFAGLAVLALAATAVWLLKDPATPVSPDAVAVLPFTVRGPAEYGYLREGVVDLLSANLDGAGTFRSVDPRAVLATTSAGAPLSPESAAALAARLGAGLFVLGDVVVAGDRIRLSASLHSRSWGGTPAAQAVVEGTPAELFRLVDRLTAQLLAASARATQPPIVGLAALTTHSLPALKHYLRGESAYRRGHYAEAFAAFDAATSEDSTFALAHYRLAAAANWAVPPGWTWDSLVARSRTALGHADRLSTRPRLLVQGYHAWLTGDYDAAERAYRTVTRSYPDEIEGWYQLAEVLFHTNPVRGRSIVEAREPLARVLAVEPDHLGAMTHLVRVAAREGNRAALDSLLARLTALSPADRQAEFRTLRAFLLGDAADQERAIGELRRSDNDEMIRASAHRIAVHGGRLDGAMRLLPLLTDRALAPDVRAHAHLWMADLEVARGRWQAARAHLDSASTLDPATALERRALLEALPFGPRSRPHLLAVLQQLRTWNAAAVPPTSYPWLAPYNGLHPQLREYLIGIVALRLGDPAETSRRAAALAAARGDGAARALASGLALSLRAHAAAARGESQRALEILDHARLRVGEGLLETEFGSQTLERWTRAELLLRAGRHEDALAWYASLPEISIAGLVYLAPMHQRLAQIAEARGRAAEAAAHYARLRELWQDADADLPALAPVAAPKAGAPLITR